MKTVRIGWGRKYGRKGRVLHVVLPCQPDTWPVTFASRIRRGGGRTIASPERPASRKPPVETTQCAEHVFLTLGLLSTLIITSWFLRLAWLILLFLHSVFHHVLWIKQHNTWKCALLDLFFHLLNSFYRAFKANKHEAMNIQIPLNDAQVMRIYCWLNVENAMFIWYGNLITDESSPCVWNEWGCEGKVSLTEIMCSKCLCVCTSSSLHWCRVH